MSKCRREDLGRRLAHSGLDRIAGRLPGGKAAVEDRDFLVPGHLERPVDARRRPEVENMNARRNDDDVAVFVNSEVADERFELRPRVAA